MLGRVYAGALMVGALTGRIWLMRGVCLRLGASYGRPFVAPFVKEK